MRCEFEVEEGEFILDAAEDEGFHWPFYCREGKCAVCGAEVLEGEIEMPDQEIITEKEKAEENVRLTCGGTPVEDDTKIIYLSQRESPALPVRRECSDTLLSEPSAEQGGREARPLRATSEKLKPVGAGNTSSYSGKVGVVWRSPVIKNASLPESDSAARRSQADGTARTGQADTQAHHSLTGLTACVQTGVPTRGILPPLVSACPAPSAWKPRRLPRGGCHNDKHLILSAISP